MIPFALSGLLTGVACLAIGLWGYVSKPSAKINRLWVVFCVAVSVWGFGGFAVGISPSYDSALISWRVAYVGVIFIPTLFYHFVTIFLDLQRTKSLACAYLASFIFLGFNAAGILIPTVSKLFPHLYYLYPPGRIYTLFVLYFVSMTLIGHVELYKFLRSSQHGKRRTQVLWFFIAFVIAYGGGTTCYLPVYGVHVYPYGNFLVPLYSLIVTYAIVRHQLLDIRIVLRKSLVYSCLIACITSAYLVMVLVMEKVFQGFFGYRSWIATAIVAFLISVFFNPLRNWIQTFADIALFKATPAELAEQHERLLSEVRNGEQFKAVAILAAGMAHEIKNPLTGLKTFAEYVPIQGHDPIFREKLHRILTQETEKIELIVHRLLDFSKPSTNRLQPVSVTQVLDETLELLSHECIVRGIRVQRAYHEAPVIHADPQQLRQAFLNLFLNSLEAMDDGGTLTLSTIGDQQTLKVIIHDTGKGIPSEALRRVGEPFFTTKAKGTGLGLSVVRTIMSEHRGALALESHVGLGTRCTLTFPLE